MPPPFRSSGLVDDFELYDTLGSTNDRVREAAADLPAGRGLLVVAREQTAGRGRGANRWWTGPGSLAFSLLFDPESRRIDKRHRAMSALATSVAIVETTSPLVQPRPVGIHWPNDVYIGEAKLAGILVEVLPDGRQIIGVGVNVNNTAASAPAELAPHVATLFDLTGREHDPLELLELLLKHMEPALTLLTISPERLALHADALCLQRDRRMTLDVGQGRIVEGIYSRIADDGALVLDTPTGPETIYSGVSVKRR